MKTLLDNMTDEALVGMLAGIRLAVMRRRHDAHFMRDISPMTPNPTDITSAVDECLPPRNTWLRSGRRIRNAVGPEKVKRMVLIRATLKGLAAPAGTLPWADNLRALLAKVREGARAPETFPLVPPAIRIVPKPGKRKKGETTEYRAISVCEDLPTRLLLGSVARYLSPLMDSQLLDCACAFRGRGKPNRDTAVRRIADYVAACHREGKQVYVAECDIRHFFDSIPQKTAMLEFNRADFRLFSREKIEFDKAAVTLVERTLAGYDYWDYARPRAEKLVAQRKNARLAGPEERPEFIPLFSGPIGLPQGGVLSPLLANLMMTEVDRVVEGGAADPGLLYLRYCDDMVILHTDPDQCRAAMRRYIDRVQALGFKIHPPRRVARYGREFHAMKSKRVYRLGPESAGKGLMPWVSFLGYQIRYDGQIRVRKDSLDRHKTRQTEFAMKLKRLLAHPHVPLRQVNESILARFAFRNVASGVGKTLSGSVPRENRCWSAAFPLLEPNRHATPQMRRLDQLRGRLVSSVMHTLRWFHPRNFGQSPDGVKRLEKKSFRPFIGRSRSYCGWLLGDKQGRDGYPSGKGRYGREF